MRGRVFTIACALIAAAGLIASGYLLASKTSDTEALALQIQRERARNVRDNCREVNRRHDNTIATLDRLIRDLPPSRRTRAVQNRAGTVLLLEALAPHRDCGRLVEQQVGTP